MQRLGVMDLHHAARAVAAAPQAQRAGLAATLCSGAHVAHKYVKRLGRWHPVWGDGSLRAATHSFAKVEGRVMDTRMLDAYITVLQCLERRLRENCRPSGV
ncbi:hypothetical protein ABMC89_02530 [Sulfitobacter sp. HNIBRBA3233]|uniref:DUF7742 family protein n=1 Tax=Sulfitobacter marinivivus TaxID=3158558 RepID=UPI0032DFA1B0